MRVSKPAAKDEKQPEGRAGTKLSRVVVDLVIFPALPDPMFRIRGFTTGPEPAFIVTSPSRGNTKLQDFLNRGHYVDYGFSNLPYFWDPEVVEYEKDVRTKLGVPAKSIADVIAPEPKQGPPDVLPDSDDSTVAKTNEALFGPPRNGEATKAVEVRPPVPQPPINVPRASPERPLRPPPPPSVKEQAIEPQPTNAPAPPPPPPSKPEVKVAVERTPDAALPRPEAEEEEVLLVSKSWYIQGGNKNRSEAVRISKVLKAFRWKVEPLYTIGVILDDMLSIETSRSHISRELIHSVESAGYRLTAVTMDQGKLAAWFKKSSSDAPSSPDSDVMA